MQKSVVVIGAFAALAACNQSAERPANNRAANAAEPKRPSFCFFKDDETRDWKAAVDAKGAVNVTGQAHVKDGRYKAQLGAPEIAGGTATVALSLANNDTGYSAPDDWWDLTASIPGAGLESVSVTCGAKAIAQLPLKKD